MGRPGCALARLWGEPHQKEPGARPPRLWPRAHARRDGTRLASGGFKFMLLGASSILADVSFVLSIPADVLAVLLLADILIVLLLSDVLVCLFLSSTSSFAPPCRRQLL